MFNEVYAPVAIPTLNRVAHLQRCLESLEENTYSDKTDVFISVDFPPSEKYNDGYKKVVQYLKEKEQSNKFKKMHIYYQSKNLGPYENIDFLLNIINKFFDVVIITEDDNEFSPNFIDYINKGLRIFKEDNRIISVCGCKEANWYNNNNSVIPLKMNPPYGVGYWFSKYNKVKNECRTTLISQEYIRKCNFKKLKKEDRTLYDLYILNILLSQKEPFWSNGHINIIDTVLTIYMHLTGCFSVVPQVSTSRTWGNDGSGINMKSNPRLNPVNEWPLDLNPKFEYVINDNVIANPLQYNKEAFFPLRENDKIENTYMRRARTISTDIKADIGFFLIKRCNFDLKKSREVLEKFKIT